MSLEPAVIGFETGGTTLMLGTWLDDLLSSTSGHCISGATVGEQMADSPELALTYGKPEFLVDEELSKA